ncbi:MAG: hypothetical protein ACR2NA_01130 [Solirubrobacterales bacterium]
MESKLHVVPDKCTGIFAGATGEMAGYLIINTESGDLKLDFLESGSRETLNADLWVNGQPEFRGP